jgi:hypothetical protein
MSFRVSLAGPETGVVIPPPQANQAPTANGGVPANPGAPGAAGNRPPVPSKPIPLPADKLTYKIRPAGPTDVYWVDIDIGSVSSAGVYAYTLAVPTASKLSGLSLDFAISVISDDLVVAPPSLDLGETPLPADKDAEPEIGQFGLRRPLRSFHIKEISATLPFLKFGIRTIVANRNYVIRLSIASGAVIKPGAYQGTIRIITDDESIKPIEVPLKVVFQR